MENAKSVLVAETDKTIRTALAMVFQEMGLAVFQTDNGAQALEIVRTRDIDVIITNIFLPRLSGIDLIKNTQDISSNTEVIVLSDIVNESVYDRMRKLGVFRLFKIPFKIDEIKDAVLRGLSSTRANRLHVEKPLSLDYMQDFIRILVAHTDMAVFQKILEISLTAGWQVDHAKDADELKKLLTIGFYDVIVSADNLYKTLDQRGFQPLTQSTCKPVLYVLSDEVQQLKKAAVPFASHIAFAPGTLKKQTFSDMLAKALPDYLSTREKCFREKDLSRVQDGAPRSPYRVLKSISRKVKDPFVVFYCIMIIFAGLAGYWVSTLTQKSAEEKEDTKQIEMLREMERYREFEKFKRQRGK